MSDLLSVGLCRTVTVKKTDVVEWGEYRGTSVGVPYMNGRWEQRETGAWFLFLLKVKVKGINK